MNRVRCELGSIRHFLGILWGLIQFSNTVAAGSRAGPIQL